VKGEFRRILKRVEARKHEQSMDEDMIIYRGGKGDNLERGS